MEETKNGLEDGSIKKGWRWIVNHPWLSLFGFLLLLLVLRIGIWVIWSDVSPEWTGFGEYTTPDGMLLRHKTLWDWMGLLIVPLVLALGVYWLNYTQKKTEMTIAQQARATENAIAENRQRQTTLETYYDRMTDLLLNYNLRETGAKDEVRNIARTRTLTVLRGLDGKRKGAILRFLHESNLITLPESVIDMEGADLTKADLEGFPSRLKNLMSSGNVDDEGLFIAFKDETLPMVLLHRANLKGVDLTGANLSHVVMIEASLNRALLNNANLDSAHLNGADLGGARLSETKLNNAILSEVNLGGASLRDSILAGANLRESHLVSAFCLRANFQRASMEGVNLGLAVLEQANMRDSNLKGADLKVANLKLADLSGANLEGASNYTVEQLLEAKSLESATMPDGTKYEEWITKNRVKKDINQTNADL